MDTMRFKGQSLELLDQTLLPNKVIYIECSDVFQIAEAIKKMQVRGAPAIGAVAAFGMALAAKQYHQELNRELLNFQKYLYEMGELLKNTRPTAVNLFWAVDKMLACYEKVKDRDFTFILARLDEEATKIYEEDIAANKLIGKFGATLLPESGSILTHCNAGALATAGYGTALGVIRAAHEAGKNIHVFADETRPLLQGARLTTFELMQDKIPVTLITDNMAAYLMAQGKISGVVVGADRIAANGDVANKIGTYGVAVLANYHHIPFYVAAPWSTVDLSIPSGESVVIEERGAEEVRSLFGKAVAPMDVQVYNPGFDITPHQLITGLITERGIITSPYHKNLETIAKKKVVF